MYVGRAILKFLVPIGTYLLNFLCDFEKLSTYCMDYAYQFRMSCRDRKYFQKLVQLPEICMHFTLFLVQLREL